MTYPPPPGLVILAYQFGSISKTEMIRLIRMWHEKHGEVSVDGELCDAENQNS